MRFLFAALLVSAVASASASEPLTFEQHVRPILKAQCFHCHGEEAEPEGGLDVRLVRLMHSGGESGAAIVPGNADSSLLWQRIAANEMPAGAKKLSAEQKAVIRRWIDDGARTARAEPENVADARFSFEELSHWAWQPVSSPSIPDVAGINHPIDAFLAQKLREQNLSFSPRADRTLLIRRLAFDLLGLPPTREQVEQFIDDKDPDAWTRLVDRFLASPQYGVRWGRHWLDVAGYAETNGAENSDTPRPHAWRYRDYVIDAFNANMPIDRFFLEQVAGDELIETDVDPRNEQHQKLLTATGFLRMAPDRTQSSNTREERNNTVAEAVKVISSAMLGLTVGCAQCHDHKYDPIAIDDYYAFRAIFDPVFPLDQWQQPSSRLLDCTSDEVRAAGKTIDEECGRRLEDINRRKKELAEQIFEARVADVPDADRAATLAAIQAEQPTEEQTRLLKLYPMVKTVSFITGFLVEYDNPAYRKFQKETADVEKFRSAKPAAHWVMTTRERPDVIPVSRVFHRGNPNSPGAEVSPQELTVLRGSRTVDIPVNEQSRSGSGRRLAWIRQLTDGTHPLAARVFVNRVWMHHFGRGIVNTPGDFGISGDRPSHAELLDWLADDFVQHGWDLKRLHRMILASTAWQQDSRRSPQTDTVDPENHLLSRMSVRRLESEAIRDGILLACGELDPKLGGPSVPVTENKEGMVVLGRRQQRDGIKTGVDNSDVRGQRRSAYVQVKRKLPLNMLATFDQPEMTPNCAQRRTTTVATQSLWFLNDESIVQNSNQLAKQLVETSTSVDERIDDLFLRLFAASPTESERQLCIEFLARQQREFVDAEGPLEQSLATLCQTLFASNRFLYVR